MPSTDRVSLHLESHISQQSLHDQIPHNPRRKHTVFLKGLHERKSSRNHLESQNNSKVTYLKFYIKSDFLWASNLNFIRVANIFSEVFQNLCGKICTFFCLVSKIHTQLLKCIQNDLGLDKFKLCAQGATRNRRERLMQDRELRVMDSLLHLFIQ